MIIDSLVKNPGCWLSMRKETGVVISSRVRLARNVRGVAFPGWAGQRECVRLCTRLEKIFREHSILSSPLFLEMGRLAEIDRDILRERHLISNELSERGNGSALIVAGDERLAVMVNEEDHLRLQAISPGLQLKESWARLDALDTEIEKHVTYAFSRQYGYLTACPSNAGTGMRASVMMHLSGLRICDEVDAVLNGLEKMGLAVRGLWGEGTQAHGNMFQISNQETLGQSEAQIIERLIRFVEEVTLHEQNARARLMEGRRPYLLDHVGRAVGILKSARVLPSHEAVDLLSAVRLGVELELLGGLRVARINQIMLLTQPGHLQKIYGRILTPLERDEMRAKLVRSKLGDIDLLE